MTDVVIAKSGDVVVETRDTVSVVTSLDTVSVITTAAEQGPPGPVGPIGQAGATYLTYLADGPLSGHRVVRPTTAGAVGYASSAIAMDANSALGITVGAALSGASIDVQAAGEMTEASWSWLPGLPVFLGLNGLLTQVPPSSGFQLVVGVAVTATKLAINIKQPIVL